jgi:hypothetical protein
MKLHEDIRGRKRDNTKIKYEGKHANIWIMKGDKEQMTNILHKKNKGS